VQVSTEPPDFRAPIDPGDPIVTAEQAEATLVRLLTKAAAKGYEAGLARGRDDERARCSALARRLAAKAFDGAIGYPDALALSDAISSGKAAT